MNIGFHQSLQLKQTLKLSQIMIQRFDILQQTSTEFSDSLKNKASENPVPFGARGHERNLLWNGPVLAC